MLLIDGNYSFQIMPADIHFIDAAFNCNRKVRFNISRFQILALAILHRFCTLLCTVAAELIRQRGLVNIGLPLSVYVFAGKRKETNS